MLEYYIYIGHNTISWKCTISMIETSRQRVKKRRKKLLVPVCEGEGCFFMRGGEAGEKEKESVWTSLARFHPRRTSRCSFHAHFINSNLSSAENWIRLIPTIDARLRPRIQGQVRRWEWCTIVSSHLNGTRRSIVSRHD